MFEIEAKKLDGTKHLLIFDDIADSFDYKNKYAIIEYLRDAFQHEYFRGIILTHNFDFFRTVLNRLEIRSNCLMSEKSGKKLNLKIAEYARNPFKTIRTRLNQSQDGQQDFSDIIAFIPFVRNLIEYRKGEDDNSFLKLTSLLHIKESSKNIKFGDLDGIFDEVSGVRIRRDLDKSVFDVLMEQAKSICKTTNQLCLVKKTVLSIAIRLQAEEYMISKINRPELTNNIHGSQTGKLFELFKTLPHIGNAKRIMERVLLMTSENIHINAFMYEPILDLSDEHLRKLYQEVNDVAL